MTTKTHLVIPDPCIVCKERPKKPSSSSWCQKCSNAYERVRWSKIPKWKRIEKWLKKKYGLTFSNFKELYDKQEGRCAVCFDEVYWDQDKATQFSSCVDHCHASGKVRGILCNHCNRALGLLKDNKEIVQNLQEYLK